MITTENRQNYLAILYLVSCSLTPKVVEIRRYKDSFHPRSSDVIYDVAGMSGMSNDVREECLECHMTSNDAREECYITVMTGRCVNKPVQTVPVGCNENTFISNFTQLCKLSYHIQYSCLLCCKRRRKLIIFIIFFIRTKL